MQRKGYPILMTKKNDRTLTFSHSKLKTRLISIVSKPIKIVVVVVVIVVVVFVLNIVFNIGVQY